MGKTSVVAGLIAALPQYHWTAFKISQHSHDGGPLNGASRATGNDFWAISEEKDRLGESDTSRFLAAGAVCAWWVRTVQGGLAEAMPAIREKLAKAPNAIVESNSIVKFLRPDLYLTVLDPATADFKKSAEEFLDLSDAVILRASSAGKNEDPAWHGVSLKPARGRPIFTIQPPPFVTPEIVNFVEKKLCGLNVNRT